MFQHQTGMSDGNRKWTIVGCDGLPYVLAQRLRDKNDELKSILMLPGPGHFEINMLRMLFKLLWHIGLKEVAQACGMVTPRALEYVKKASDHHRGWGMLKILHSASLRFLISPYVKECETTGILPTVGGFYCYLKQSTSPTVNLIQVIHLNYVTALFMYRSGIRNGHSNVALYGRIAFSPLFYSNNMTTYMDIHFRDIVTRMKAPASVHDMIMSHESFSECGSADHREGGDFVLENRNRRTKMWIPPGVPTHDQWRRTCRTLDDMEKVTIM